MDRMDTRPYSSDYHHHHPKDQQVIRNRNRNAARRYRDKLRFQTDEMEVRATEATERRRALAQEASQLETEVFALKNRVFEHALCECPLIQAYLERALRGGSVRGRVGG